MVLCGLWDFINKNLPQSLPQLEHASVAQLVERRIRNAYVRGSNPLRSFPDILVLYSNKDRRNNLSLFFTLLFYLIYFD